MLTVDARELQRVIAGLQAGISPGSLLAELTQQTAQQTQRRFDRRQAPDGTPWPPRRDAKPHPLLEETGRLRRSIRERELQEREGAVATAGVPYAAAHQWGYEPGGLPQREFLGWGDDDLRDLEQTADGWLERHVGELLS